MALSRRVWVGHVALFLAFFGALAPTLSHALNWARGETPSLIEVCTSQGPRWMALAQPAEPLSNAPNQPDAATVYEHCPFCLLAVDRLAPPPVPIDLRFLNVAGPQAFVAAPDPWLLPHLDPSPVPRGPPFPF
jgi:hypothetical protein